MNAAKQRRFPWRTQSWALVALPLAACVVPTFDLQPEDGSDEGPNDGGAGADGTGASTTDGVGGSSGSGGSGPSGGGSSAGGQPGDGGTGGSNSGGSDSGGSGSGGSGSGGAPDVDENGKENAVPSTLSTPGDYFRLGDFRLVNDQSGVDALGCSTPSSLYVVASDDFGWDFNRGNCGQTDPEVGTDFPHLEIGIHPFGDALVTELDFSSTTLLPIQLKDLTAASLDLAIQASLQGSSSWTTELRLWFSERNPVTDSDPGVHSQVAIYWGWSADRWPSAPGEDGSESIGDPPIVAGPDGPTPYSLWGKRLHADGYQYLQFRSDDGPTANFTGTVNLTAFLSVLEVLLGFSEDLWLSQFQIGSSVGDNTAGDVSMGYVTLELNGQGRSPQTQ